VGIVAIFVLVIWIWIELILEIVASIVFEVVLAFTHALDKDKGDRGSAAFLLSVTGVFYGALVLSPIRLPLKFSPVVSLFALPVFVGLAMLCWGQVRTKRGKSLSHLGTWYGGAALGAGLAAGRVVVLAFVGAQ
jgi:hypothetical protein